MISKVKLKFKFPEIRLNNSNIVKYDQKSYKPHVRVVKVMAYNSQYIKGIDITNYCDSEGDLAWSEPKGKWKIRCFVSICTGQPLKVQSINSVGLMLDHFSAEAQEVKIKYVADKLTSRLGPNLGAASLKYIYNDSYEVSGWIWSLGLPMEFKKRRGYDLLPYLPALFDSSLYSVQIH